MAWANYRDLSELHHLLLGSCKGAGELKVVLVLVLVVVTVFKSDGIGKENRGKIAICNVSIHVDRRSRRTVRKV